MGGGGVGGLQLLLLRGRLLVQTPEAALTAPPERNVLMLGLLCRGVKDALPTVNLHSDIKLKVDVSFGCWATEAAVGRCARPALAE